MAVGEMSEAEFIGFLTSGLSSSEHGPGQSLTEQFILSVWTGVIWLRCSRPDERFIPNLRICVFGTKTTEVWAHSIDRSKNWCSYLNGAKLLTLIRSNSAGTGAIERTYGTIPGVNTRDLKLHPTVKPLALVIDAIKDCSRRNEIVLDPFAGSGTTIIAAEKSGRRARGIEIDPLYVDLAIRRWQLLTGKTAHSCECK